MLELNDVLIRGEHSTLSLMVHEGELTCLTRPGAVPAASPCRWLHAIMGFEPVVAGYISIDGEPLTPRSAFAMRRMMAFVPASLDAVGQIVPYEPPTVQDIFRLKANRQLSISNGLLAEEMRRTGLTGMSAQLLAVAALLNRHILLVDRPAPACLPYLLQQAAAGKIVVMTSNDPSVVSYANNVTETN